MKKHNHINGYSNVKGLPWRITSRTILINCIHLHSSSLSFVFHGPILPCQVYSHCSHQCCSCLKQAAVFSDKALKTPLHVICETPNCRQAWLVCSCPFHSISPAGRQEFVKTNTKRRWTWISENAKMNCFAIHFIRIRIYKNHWKNISVAFTICFCRFHNFDERQLFTVPSLIQLPSLPAGKDSTFFHLSWGISQSS